MNVAELQGIIGARPDGVFGPQSKAKLMAAFTNPEAPAVTTLEMQAFADRLGCSLRQIAAVGAVESAGSGFDRYGRPKLLFERHLFHRMTNGRWTPAPFSQPDYGGYSEDSWAKLGSAAACNPDPAFSSASWGAFQVLGSHWQKLGYTSAFDLAHSCVANMAGHYELLCRYIEVFGLKTALRKLSRTAADCAEFARLYNGPDFRRNRYDAKLAGAMA